jgi:starvation-inducible DNA-binding protein
MEQLLSQLRTLLADNVALKFKAHGYHWNVEGDDFKPYHEFFGEIYENFDGATDTFAEWLRAFQVYAPYRLTDFFDMSDVPEPVIVGDAQPMLQDLLLALTKHVEDLVAASDTANLNKQYGLANFLADRQTISQKFLWQIRASIEVED